MDSGRRTKIVATLGPATDDPAVIAGMVGAGLDVARINFSHGTRDSQRKRVDTVRAAALAAGRNIGILADLAGPKIRIESFAMGSVQLVEGEPFALDTALDATAGNDTEVGCAYQNLPNDVRAGDTLLLADGQIVLGVERVAGTRIHCVVRVGGELSNRKGLNRQGGGISAPALTDKDLADVQLAAELGIDYLAVSFARDGDDMRRAQQELRKWRGEARVVAKIERHEALDNLAGILAVTDAVMVARGDLGVEMGYAELTGLQKTIIRQSLARHRVVITATQMMESMIQNPMPTRAEVSDVANAVLDGTDAVMLSAETAAGKYPVRAVQAMSEVIRGAEKYQLGAPRGLVRVEDEFSNTEEAISRAVMYTANHMRVRAIVALTESGLTPLWMSRIRADIPIYAFTRHEATRRRVTLYRGVYAVPFDITDNRPPELYRAIFERLLAQGLVDVDDLVILTKGELSGVSGGTNSMQIVRVTQP
ncbi:MAG: pyruvate kinase [Gammaproteobacteria bacterium]|nr:pyruvate kinase [Gammaproteobacteria bacterium]MDE2249826.1 pyruvate kinase [Gammaproteobacteria bacterium]